MGNVRANASQALSYNKKILEDKLGSEALRLEDTIECRNKKDVVFALCKKTFLNWKKAVVGAISLIVLSISLSPKSEILKTILSKLLRIDKLRSSDILLVLAMRNAGAAIKGRDEFSIRANMLFNLGLFSLLPLSSCSFIKTPIKWGVSCVLTTLWIDEIRSLTSKFISKMRRLCNMGDRDARKKVFCEEEKAIRTKASVIQKAIESGGSSRGLIEDFINIPGSGVVMQSDSAATYSRLPVISDTIKTGNDLFKGTVWRGCGETYFPAWSWTLKAAAFISKLLPACVSSEHQRQQADVSYNNIDMLCLDNHIDSGSKAYAGQKVVRMQHLKVVGQTSRIAGRIGVAAAVFFIAEFCVTRFNPGCSLIIWAVNLPKYISPFDLQLKAADMLFVCLLGLVGSCLDKSLADFGKKPKVVVEETDVMSKLKKRADDSFQLSKLKKIVGASRALLCGFTAITSITVAGLLKATGVYRIGVVMSGLGGLCLLIRGSISRQGSDSEKEQGIFNRISSGISGVFNQLSKEEEIKVGKKLNVVAIFGERVAYMCAAIFSTGVLFKSGSALSSRCMDTALDTLTLGMLFGTMRRSQESPVQWSFSMAFHLLLSSPILNPTAKLCISGLLAVAMLLDVPARFRKKTSNKYDVK